MLTVSMSEAQVQDLDQSYDSTYDISPEGTA
jgi:hypothetical protein